MTGVAVEKLVALQRETSQVRNICILAHVDHGKTTLSDCLVSSNGIISERLAGTIRFMDSREDEQERGITMKSSAISLLFRHERLNKEYLVNLIDSPGHVDFSSDVSTAVRLCDGALIVVDVIEGVAIQTHAVLRQAWEERLQPCLVLNKVDRLITELKLDPIEAYEHLSRIIEHVNAILQGFFSASVMEKSSNDVETEPNSQTEVPDSYAEWMLEYDEDQERALEFSPERGNVVFASAVDSWAFRVIDFVPMISELIDMPPKRVLRGLWGNYFFNAKTKKIIETKQIETSVTTGQALRSKPPMFATYVLQSIWHVYDATVLDSKPKRLEKIISTIGIESKVNKRDVGKGGKLALRAVMHAWLPVTRAILSMVVKCVPNPGVAQKRRVEILWPRDQTTGSPEMEEQLLRSREAVANCDPDGPLVAFVTKVFAVERKHLPPATVAKLEAHRKQYESKSLTNSTLPPNEVDNDKDGEELVQEEFFFAFARVFSGTAKENVPVFVLGPKYVPGNKERERHCAEVQSGVLPMLMMNTELVALSSVPAGNILALAGLDRDVLKTATVTDSRIANSLSKMPSQSAPILRVSLEPENPLEWAQLSKGLRLLNRADPVAEIRVQPNGEHILGAIGELHLERCVKDLKDRFARIEIKVSKPIAIFRETIVPYSPEESPLPKPHPKQAFPTVLIKDELELAAAHLAAVTTQEAQSNEDSTPDQDSELQQAENGATAAPKFVPLSKKVFPGGKVIVSTMDHSVNLLIRSIPLPENITRTIESLRPKLSRLVDASEDHVHASGEEATLEEEMNALELLAQRNSSRRQSSSARQSASGSVDKLQPMGGKNGEEIDGVESIETVRASVEKELQNAFVEAGVDWGEDTFKRILALGPRGVGCNTLINMIEKGPLKKRRNQTLFNEDNIEEVDENEEDAENDDNDEDYSGSSLLWEEILTGIVAGFQLACRSGPICEEPLWGVAVLLEQVYVNVDDRQSVANMRQKRQATIAGQVMSNVRESIRRSVDIHRLHHEHHVQTGCQLRLVEGILSCLLQCHVDSHQGDQLGKMYSVLSKRRAKILSEDMWEGTSIFTVEAEIPVVESFNLGYDLRRQTSGAASTPQLVFSHWSVIEENPFFRATTEDELEEFGERGYEESYQAHNVAFRYIQEIRKRKGLATSAKVVVAAEKQRTLAKKK